MRMRIVHANKTRWRTTFLLGLIHLLLYVRFILMVPILLVAAGLLAGWDRWNGPACARNEVKLPACASAESKLV